MYESILTSIFIVGGELTSQDCANHAENFTKEYGGSVFAIELGNQVNDPIAYITANTRQQAYKRAKEALTIYHIP